MNLISPIGTLFVFLWCEQLIQLLESVNARSSYLWARVLLQIKAEMWRWLSLTPTAVLPNMRELVFQKSFSANNVCTAFKGRWGENTVQRRRWQHYREENSIEYIFALQTPKSLFDEFMNVTTKFLPECNALGRPFQILRRRKKPKLAESEHVGQFFYPCYNF